MPMYDYECEACAHVFETYQSMSDDKLTQCPKCGKAKLVRCIYAPLLSYVSSPKTLGALADRNASRMSKDEKESIKRSQKTEKTGNTLKQMPAGMERVEQKPLPKSWFKKNQTISTKKLIKMSAEQQTKYIITGKD